MLNNINSNTHSSYVAHNQSNFKFAAAVFNGPAAIKDEDGQFIFTQEYLEFKEQRMYTRRHAELSLIRQAVQTAIDRLGLDISPPYGIGDITSLHRAIFAMSPFPDSPTLIYTGRWGDIRNWSIEAALRLQEFEDLNSDEITKQRVLDKIELFGLSSGDFDKLYSIARDVVQMRREHLEYSINRGLESLARSSAKFNIGMFVTGHGAEGMAEREDVRELEAGLLDIYRQIFEETKRLIGEFDNDKRAVLLDGIQGNEQHWGLLWNNNLTGIADVMDRFISTLPADITINGRNFANMGSLAQARLAAMEHAARGTSFTAAAADPTKPQAADNTAPALSAEEPELARDFKVYTMWVEMAFRHAAYLAEGVKDEELWAELQAKRECEASQASIRNIMRYLGLL